MPDKAATDVSPVTVQPMTSEADALAFKHLNEEWITRLFALEPADKAILDDPVGEIVNKGGHVLIARIDHEIVGCVALVPAGGGEFELGKMTVAPALRGQGVGRAIVVSAIDFARSIGARSLFLGSSRKLPAAIHLYESVGFQHVPLDQLGPMPYARADVFMRCPLS